MDIDYLCILITKINLALYAPWFYIPESFFPPREEKVVIELPDAPEIPPTPATPTTLFNLLEVETGESKSKKKATAKIYKTEIEQPSLFDFG